MDIIKIGELIEQNGGRLYLVGGALRDSLLNRPIYDEDYCVVGIEKDTFVQLFPEAISRGKAFEVFDIGGKEFALARTEKKTGRGHKEFEITIGKNITIEEDLKRRDITINAIAKDVLTGKIIDPFNGIKDIENKIIRAIGDSFLEDPLRVYRVARFASELEFEVEENTLKYMNDLRSELDTLSKERVFVEFRKALASNKPSKFFNILKKANVLDIHFKEIYDLIGSLQPIKYHPEGDSYNHTMIAIDNSVNLTKDLLIRYACLVHDLGKGLTPKEEYPHHHGHAAKGVEPVRNLSNRIGTPISWKKAGITSSKEHMRGGRFAQMSDAKKVDFIERVSKSTLGLEGLQIVVYCDRNRFGSLSKEEKEKCTFLDLGNKLLIEIDGNYIKKKYNIENGIQFGNKLHEERVKWMKSVQKNARSKNLKNQFFVPSIFYIIILMLQQLLPFHLRRKFPS